MKTAYELKAEISRLEEELGKVEGTKTEVYTRIVGYYRSVKNWNKGKREEYRFRETFALPHQVSPKKMGRETGSAEGQSVRGRAAGAGFRSAVALPEEISWMLFTKETCVKCPPVKEYVGKLPLKGTMVDVDSEDGLRQAKKYSVLSAPTAVFLDKSGKEVFRAHAVEEIASRIGAVRV